jgi:isochorismate synthase
VCRIRPDVVIDLDHEEGRLDGVAHREVPDKEPQPGLVRTGYRTAVEQATRSIRGGLLNKVVLARTVDLDLDGPTAGQLFAEATRHMPSAFIALVRTDHTGTWLGASPERLLTLRNGMVEVDALAGTMAAQDAPEDPAGWGLKEREEQDLVTRMITRTLAEQGVQGLRTEGPRNRVAGPVAHLYTKVTGTTAGIEALELAHALHPTPAVGGTPRQPALDLIDQLEPRDRGLYAGYWGPVEPGRADLYVNIRCMELYAGKALLHVGAGITAGSDPDSECDEVERKAGTWSRLVEALRQPG